MNEDVQKKLIEADGSGDIIEWCSEIWVERGEDYYALSHYKNKTVRIIEREDWLKA